MLNSDWLIPSLVALLTSFAATWMVRYVALHKDWMDEPNHRSSHVTPTPKSGGIGVIIGLLIGGIAAHWFAVVSLPLLFWLLISSGVLIGILGWADDHWHLSPRLRLVFHFLASGLVLFVLPELPLLSGLEFLPSILLVGLYLVALVWFLNLFNFMDGIDGIAGIETVTILAGCLLISFFFGESAQRVMLASMLVVAAVFGFLVLNWAPAKIFMGDAGSGFIGLLLPALLMWISIEAKLDFLSLLILTGMFVVDATVTLVRRFIDGQKLSEAHRSHMYQILSRSWKSHGQVSSMTGLINLLWLLPLAVASIVIDKPSVTWLLLLVAWGPLGIMVYRSGAGLRND